MRIDLVCHDGGGAEIVGAWAGSRSEDDLRFCLAGPARSVFERRFGPLEVLDLDAMIAAWESQPPDLVVTGTGWASDLEMRAMEKAAQRGLRCAAYLDHWTHYSRRFPSRGSDWIDSIPDEIWCGDDHALLLCRELGIPASRLRRVPNLYFVELNAMRRPLQRDDEGTVLYVADPISAHMQAEHGDPMYLGYTEFTALEYFLERIDLLAFEVKSVVLRPHPSEKRDRYEAWLKRATLPCPVELSTQPEVVEDCLRARAVVGCESMAMVLGLMLGREVFCSIPPQGAPGALPFAEIRRL